MPYSTSQRGKQLFSLTVTLLIAVGTNTLAANTAPLTNHVFLPAIHPTPVFFHLRSFLPHNLRNSPLYKGDTVLRNGVSSGFIRRERNGDLVIAIPDAVREKYKIRFFDNDDNFLFEVRQIRDPMLIVEKYNFRHTGLFQYELYRENLLVERSTFLIRKD